MYTKTYVNSPAWIFDTFVIFVFISFFYTANPYIIQNQQYTQNYQHQHPPHQQSHYNGSNQFEQQQPHTLQPPHQQQQQNTNFIHSVSSSQQHQPHRGDNGLSASVVRRQKRPTTTVGKLQQVIDNDLK